MKPQVLIRTAAILALVAVVLGALGAHALRDSLSVEQIESFKTGVRYQMWHALALLAISKMGGSLKFFNAIVWSWIVGVIFFSGSIYLLNLDELFHLELSFLGPITPLGGLAMIIGWTLLVIGTLSESGAPN